MAVTQKQIAEKVGVSQQLVTLALRNHPRVAAETRRKILRAAKSLGYDQHTNRHARRLAAGKHGRRVASGIIAVIYEPTRDSDQEPPRQAPAPAMPYFMPFVNGIETETGERELDLFLVPSRPSGLPWLLREGWVDGVILLGAHKNLYGLEKLDVPVLNLGGSFENAHSLLPDEESGFRQLMRHLIELGHTEIAYLAPMHWQRGLPRFNVYREMLAEHGLPFREELVEGDLTAPTLEEGAAGVKRLLPRHGHAKLPFTALVCHNDPIAIGATRVLFQSGIHVPNQVSVTGFDDVSLQYNFEPAITSVAFPGFTMGRRAVQLLCEEIAATSLETNTVPIGKRELRHETFAVELVVRQSTAPVNTIQTSRRTHAQTA